MMRRTLWALLGIAALAWSAHAQVVWTEQGDAGSLPDTAQSTGTGSLSQIQGNLDVNDVDMYAIYIDDPASFSATTVGGASWDTQLFLFDADGKGVVAEDDTGGLQSTINNANGCIPGPGLYYLAITRYNKDPLGCNDGGLWSSNDNNCPNGPESTSRVASWTSSTGAAGAYTISLTGVSGATAGDPADCPPFEGWDETANGGGDAGDLPETAQSTGSGPLSAIRGTIGAANDVDVYAIYISDPSTFSATTVGGASLDTALWLFDENGKGVVFNEDDADGTSFQSRIDNRSNCITQPGRYYLAISLFGRRAAGCNDGLIWQTTPYRSVRCPDGVEPTSRLAGWSGSTSSTGTYRIFLTGVSGATAGDPADCPPFEGWDETANGGGDAGDLPETAQSTGSGPLSAIRGTIGAANDVDVYAIYISDPSTFSATTVGGTSLNTALWLFDENGKGVVFNEDDADGTSLQSRIDNRSNCITQPGLYYLAISLFGRRAAGCDDGLIWQSTPYRSVRCPDGVEPTSRLAGWSGSTSSTGTYRIFLTGVSGATAGDPDDCPPPTPWDESYYGGGDAGDLPATAQLVTLPDATPCQTPVQRVRGNLEADGVDMYVICITDPANFVATTVGSAGFDTQLWLFKCDGTGVAFNDDSTGLQSTLNLSALGTNCQLPPAGTYLLAVSRYNRDAVDASGQLLWNNTPFSGVRCPDGQGASNPVAGWTGTTSAGGTYIIQLQGAYFVSTAGCETPPPGCEGDATGDGRVDDADLLAVLFAFGNFCFGCPEDVSGNNFVDDDDLLRVLFNFGCGS